MASLPNIDLSNLDFSKFELPKFDLPKLELPKFELPAVDLPNVELPDTERVVGFARDAAYVTIGLAVLGAEEAQKLGREVVTTVKNGVEQLRDALI